MYGKNDHLMDKLKYLTENDIELHAQVVLMPKLNDGRYRIFDDNFDFKVIS